MSLTAEQYQQLKDQSLVELFKDNRIAFTKLAKTAYAFAKEAIAPSKQPVRQGDVESPLLQSLTYNEKLKKQISSKQLRQKYWMTWFTELVLEQTWEELQQP